MSSANLSDPTVLRDFRRHLGEFLRDGHSALGGVVNQFYQVEEHLRGELQAHWKSQQRRREEVYGTARLAYLAAKAEVDANQRGRGGGRQSCDEERMDMNKAKRHLDEAEDKLAMIQRWLLRLRQDGEPLVARCRNHDLGLDDLVTRGMQSLEQKATSIEAYHDVSMPQAPVFTGPVGGGTSHGS